MTDFDFDNVVSFHIDSGAFRGKIIRLGKTADIILNKHKYPKPVAGALCESMALGVVLASSLKYDGLFTLQTQTNGPVSSVVVDVNSQGKMRAFARYDEEQLTHAQTKRKTLGEIEPAPHLFCGGHMAFTVDQGSDMNSYQGIVELEGNTLADCAHKYFRQSEQIETAIRIAIIPPEDGSEYGWRACAIMLQRMPESGDKLSTNKEDLDNAWIDAITLLGSMTDKEMLSLKLSPADVIYRLYHSNELTLTDSKRLEFGCRCSRKKVEQTLKSFAREELSDMKKDDGNIGVTCQFCSTEYLFTEEDLYKE